MAGGYRIRTTNVSGVANDYSVWPLLVKSPQFRGVKRVTRTLPMRTLSSSYFVFYCSWYSRNFRFKHQLIAEQLCDWKSRGLLHVQLVIGIQCDTLQTCPIWSAIRAIVKSTSKELKMFCWVSCIYFCPSQSRGVTFSVLRFASPLCMLYDIYPWCPALLECFHSWRQWVKRVFVLICRYEQDDLVVWGLPISLLFQQTRQCPGTVEQLQSIRSNTPTIHKIQHLSCALDSA